MKRILAPFAFLALVPLLGVTSCASLFSDYCDSRMNCEGGNDKDKAACADSLRGEEKAASDYGCSDQFDGYYTCRHDHSACVNGRYESNCDGPKNAYDACVKANSARK